MPNYALPTSAPLGQMPQRPGAGAPAGLPGGMGGIPPDLLQQVLALGSQTSQQDILNRQRKLADALRGMGNDQLQGITVGPKGREQYRAPGVANVLANVYANYRAGQLSKEADEQQRGLGDQRQAAITKYFEALNRGRE